MPKEIPSRFDPGEVERRWQSGWAEAGLFTAPSAPAGPRFAIVLPPPNVTGVLTLGHMLGDTVMDVLARRQRMKGAAVLWLPGLDHAGLATQVAVRRHLAKENVRLEDLPRERILEQIGRWKEAREATIRAQTVAAGFSVDWTRYRYTMDERSVRATREVFVRLFRDGLLYRGERIVNWDPRLRTAVSNLEVVHREEAAELLYLCYRWEDGSPGGLVVATVRPETIFGDVAVAVHPDDPRHAGAIGRKVRVPLVDRPVPVIADAAIDRDFGNGALKVTPAHDLLDHEIGRRHPELGAPPTILDEAGRLSGENVPEAYRGVDRAVARELVTTALEAAGAIVRREPYRHSVARSERSDDVIEPRLSTQWFVRLGALAPPAVEAVRTGAVRIHPDRWELTFFRWVESLEDWCISRQVVWGHAIPVHYCETCGEVIASVDPPDACPKCEGRRLRPDPDVLDTWFTSWLWPFVTLGWPERTPELARYYPTSVLVTGRDIMFFWVARMMMAGARFAGGPPFDHVYFTGMLRDETGRKMSKHLGNSPEPLDLIRRTGADALRFALLHPNPVDQDGPFTEATLEGGRNFLTKIWNLGRFLLGHLPDGAAAPGRAPDLDPGSALENRWILARWRATAESVDAALDGFEPTVAASLLYQFLWHDVADRYVEMAKDALRGDRGEIAQRDARAVLLFVLERTLRLLHPFVPHVTEELWHALPHEGEWLAVSPWPLPADAPADPEAVAAMEVLWDGIRTLRNLRAEADVPAAELPEARLLPTSPESERILLARSDLLTRLGRVSRVTWIAESSGAPEGAARSVTPHGEYFLVRPAASLGPAGGLAREREKLQTILDRTRARLADEGFRARAPAHVVAEAEEKARELSDRIRRIDGAPASAPSGGP